MTSENIILIDWFAFSCKLEDPHLIIDSIGLSSVKFITTSGHYGYKSAKYYGGIWVLYDGRDGMGCCVEMSGQGCRQYETSGDRKLEDLVNFVASNHADFHITRLDVAFDDVDHVGRGLLDVQKIDGLARRDRYVSKFKSKSGSWSAKHSDDSAPDKIAYSVYFGSSQSDVRFRIYDKSMERGGLDYHWVRFEIQLRDDSALNFITSPGTVGSKFSGVINNYLRFIVPQKNDSNRRRWPSPSWWVNFVSSTEKISLYTAKDIEYNLSRLERYVLMQCGNSILTYIQCVGLPYFYQSVQGREDFLNEHQRKLVSEYNELELDRLKKIWKAHPQGL